MQNFSSFSKIWIIGILAVVAAGGVLAWQYLLPKKVSFDDLVSNPEKYNKSNVTVEGFYLFAFEVNVFAKELVFSPPDNRVHAKEPLIWVGAGKGLDDLDFSKLNQQTRDGEKELVYYGKVKITGRFEYGGEYGHLGSYNYRINSFKVEILPWSPSSVGCTEEGKVCPDGSAVGRTGPNCEFASCPAAK